MGSTRVYIKPFKEDGTYADDFIDVTKHVFNIGTTKLDADSLDFQIGTYRTSSVQISANNRSGIFSDVDQSESMFKYKRTNSIVRITWDLNSEPLLCGFFPCGNVTLGGEVTIFEGLLSDDSLKEQSSSEAVDFQVLGYESIFDETEAPFASLSVGQLGSEIIFACLNQSPITDLLIIDSTNIALGTDLAVDSIDSLENQTVKEVIDLILANSNSVLYIENGAVHVKQRTPAAAVTKTFYGQASQNGIENLIDVKNITNGMPRTWNYFWWNEQTSTAVQKNLTSIRKYGVLKKDVRCDLYTDNLKQNQILADLLAEFKDPKKECEIVTRLNYDTIALNLLDRISIDYPTVFEPTEGFALPICGIAICGNGDTSARGAVLPLGLWSLTVDPTDQFKILSKEINALDEIVTFKVRKI